MLRFVLTVSFPSSPPPVTAIISLKARFTSLPAATFSSISITSETRHFLDFCCNWGKVWNYSGPKQSLSIIQLPSGPGRANSSLSCWESSTIHVKLRIFRDENTMKLASLAHVATLWHKQRATHLFMAVGYGEKSEKLELCAILLWCRLNNNKS